MIRNTFQFLPKIKQKKEENLWKQGILTGDDFLKSRAKGISKKSKAYYDRQISEAKIALRESDSSYFCGKLSSAETWCLYDHFREEAVFLDIEASDASLSSYLTVIGLFDGVRTKTMIRDVNFDEAILKKELAAYKLIVTFNGNNFDIPFLNKKYPGIVPTIPIIDLRHLCARIRLTGGLKEIEEQLGIKRHNAIVERLYGGDPLKLWRMFKGSGDDYYLKLLVEYNEEDVINLKKIAEHVVSILRKEIVSKHMINY
ncbi:MAG: ribonuclease H-like domain-containing protein [archaeon]